MKRFAAMFAAIDTTTGTLAKVQAMVEYFSRADARDAAWAAWFLTGHRPRQAVPTRRLHAWAAEASGLPEWLFAESYDAVGDSITYTYTITNTGNVTLASPVGVDDIEGPLTFAPAAFVAPGQTATATVTIAVGP